MHEERLIARIQETVHTALDEVLEKLDGLEYEVHLLNERLGDRALKVSELAGLAEVSTHTIYRRIKEGRVPLASRRPIRILWSEYKAASEKYRW